jgi:hypothetical protein
MDSTKFAHRPHADGKVESICLRCYLFSLRSQRTRLTGKLRKPSTSAGGWIWCSSLDWTTQRNRDNTSACLLVSAITTGNRVRNFRIEAFNETEGDPRWFHDQPGAIVY